jgi:hypothetical protein
MRSGESDYNGSGETSQSSGEYEQGGGSGEASCLAQNLEEFMETGSEAAELAVMATRVGQIGNPDEGMTLNRCRSADCVASCVLTWVARDVTSVGEPAVGGNLQSCEKRYPY